VFFVLLISNIDCLVKKLNQGTVMTNLVTFYRSHLALNAYIKNKGWERLPPAGLGKGMVYWLGKVS